MKFRSAWGDPKTQFFFNLTPDRVLDSVESLGFICTGRCSPMNSMENRVYDVEIETENDSGHSVSMPARFRVVKFYRPGRWSEEQILEEHQFLLKLSESEIPVVAPLAFKGRTLFTEKESGIHFAVFPRIGGRSFDEFSDAQLERMGRLIARIHIVGSSIPASHRIELGVETYGLSALEYLMDNQVLPETRRDGYRSLVESVCEAARPLLAASKIQTLHGDCHLGNLLWDRESPFFLDFDDMVRGPAVQDLWLMVPGRDPESRRQFEVLLQAYEQMTEFDRGSLCLIEPLRTLRMIHFHGWIAKRWEDPAFPRAFPQFGTEKYWEEAVQDLREQLSLIQGA